MDFYLDINHEGEIANIIEEVHKRNKPFLLLITLVMIQVEEVIFFHHRNRRRW